MTTRFLGEEGFRWFIGVIADRDDPEKRGRVRIRVFGVHDQDQVLVPTNTLPWGIVLLPGTSASFKQIGTSATGLVVGSTVIGFFLDGNEATMPVIFGVLPGLGDMPQLAAGQPAINKELIGPEPASAFRAQYPFNKVVQTESGHVFEVDDTPNFQRLHTYHRSGTYEEIDADGTKVNKIVGDGFEIIQKNKTVFIQGNLNITVNGEVTITSPSVRITGNVTIDGETTITGNLQVQKSVTAADDIVGKGVSVSGHVHGNVASGPDVSGPAS
jgi:phage baseplate assembly protein gpV